VLPLLIGVRCRDPVQDAAGLTAEVTIGATGPVVLDQGTTWKLLSAILLDHSKSAVLDSLRSPESKCAVDGLAGDERVFLACSFWLVDNYVLQRRAPKRFEMVARKPLEENPERTCEQTGKEREQGQWHW
jgi:hypothetical protein